MRKKKKKKLFGKKFKLNYAGWAVACCLMMLMVIPIQGDSVSSSITYNEVLLNGEVIGAVADPEVVNQAFLNARARIARETEGLVLGNVECSFQKVPRLFGTTLEQSELENVIYDLLKEQVKAAKQKYYLVKVNEFTVYLYGIDEVKALLEAALKPYDPDELFEVNVISDTSRELNVFTVEVTPKEELAEGDGLKALNFSEKVEISEAYVDADRVSKISEAIEAVTKETEKNQTYEVQPGDTLSVIANSRGYYVDEVLALNPGLTRDATLHLGDEIVISVPEPELSVLTTEQSTYEEDYDAETQYIENDSWYTTQQVVRQEAVPGHHEVTVLTTSRNGTETSREMVSENVITEPVPEIIEKGTQTPPTYIKPITGGTLTSTFKWRWGRMHKGIDWAVPKGTAVRASCGGTVVSAGWSGGYGNCITIRHPDGKQTRYGHLSKILVSAGQKVDQGQKIALSGNTGRSTGPHVHFEILVNGTQVNPLKYLQ
ncbi:LysM peptidoglycan-binding domain-containing protein [Clostridiaceae bacterium OM08-6BH]|nr:LysM peptidoglycan-binding domain-containing protein [Clostridiaceae bacterium OM08-6BH]